MTPPPPRTDLWLVNDWDFQAFDGHGDNVLGDVVMERFRGGLLITQVVSLR